MLKGSKELRGNFLAEWLTVFPMHYIQSDFKIKVMGWHCIWGWIPGLMDIHLNRFCHLYCLLPGQQQQQADWVSPLESQVWFFRRWFSNRIKQERDAQGQLGRALLRPPSRCTYLGNPALPFTFWLLVRPLSHSHMPVNVFMPGNFHVGNNRGTNR